MARSIMALGPFQFQALGFGFTRRARSTRNEWAQLQVAGGQTVSQWTGGDGSTETISGVLFSEFGGMSSLEGIRIASQAGTPLPLVDLSNGLANVFGMHIVEGIEEDRDAFGADGAALRNAYSLSLRSFYGGLEGFVPLSVLSLFR